MYSPSIVARRRSGGVFSSARMTQTDRPEEFANEMTLWKKTQAALQW